MSGLNIFQNATKTVPTSDEQIVRVSMEQIDIAGRKSHLPAQEKSGAMTLSHVGASGATGGSK
jgi:hypothetical protein